MKREGRQRGMVRNYPILPSPWNPRPEFRVLNKFDSPPTAGLFTKVSSKPNNHSKFTGKCSRARCFGCHIHPACKSKDKTKGTQKLRSGDVVANHRLVSWRVVDNKGNGLNLSGLSATGILGHLSNDHWDDDYEGDDVDGDEEEEEDVHGDSSSVLQESRCMKKEEEIIEIVNDEVDNMSFCDVGFVLDQEDEEGWCLVGEM